MALAIRRRRVFACIAGSLALVVATATLAQGNQVYRYEDANGRVYYSDRPPPADAKKAQAKRVGANFVETDAAPLATQQAVERFPVTLYTFSCGEVCQTAEGLLNKRGVPFTTVNVEEPANAARLQALTGEMTAPVLQVGDKLVAKGYNEARWTAMLDEAGYPKAPPPRRTVPGARPPEPPRAETQSAAPAPKGGGYPAQ
ncbi:MAG TPA: glutaredoxin family protein [Casimicrobiaceae bacterium]|nr:glutaredoxin family protein [Casimicrobiaceae bacterium]